TAARHHEGCDSLLRAARDAATREGATMGRQSDPGGGSRIARLLPAVRGTMRLTLNARVAIVTLVILFLPASVFADKRPPRWLINGVCGLSGGLAFTEIVGTERCVQRGSCREVNVIMPKGTDAKS